MLHARANQKGSKVTPDCVFAFVERVASPEQQPTWRGTDLDVTKDLRPPPYVLLEHDRITLMHILRA